MEADENTACNGSPCLPELTSVDLNPSGTPKYYGGLQVVQPKQPITYTQLQSINIVADDCASFQLSSDDITYRYWDGSQWAPATLAHHRSSKGNVSNNLLQFGSQFGPGKLYLKGFLETSSNQTSSCSISEIDLSFK